MNNFASFLSAESTRPFIYALMIADLILRGLALYQSARKEQRVWFAILLILNTAGLLPLVYLVLQKITSSKIKTILLLKKKGKTKG